MSPSQLLRLRMEKQWYLKPLADINKICCWDVDYHVARFSALPKLTLEEIKRAESPTFKWPDTSPKR